MKNGNCLPTSFYDQDTISIARRLLGMTLVHRTICGTISATIVETEAYLWNDPASHSFGRRTERNNVMFDTPGRAYVYLSYGIHEMLNVVTAPKGVGEAVLIRAAHPVGGIEIMRTNCGQVHVEAHRLASGPGKLTRAFGINRAVHNGLDLTSPESLLSIEHGEVDDSFSIMETRRIGISKAVEMPWRFYIAGSKAVSRK
jgi:DNA-3-methyladenine glycosylase